MLKHRINPEYVETALKRATYKQLEDNGSYFGEIPGFQGVWANEPTLEACRLELAETLEDWLDLSLSRNLPVPDLEGIKLIAE
ncbi:MAG TPA: type II toxin-antitoxin system HicB family antitoxin [Chloroflexia bacterium]|nr:type II toxin-antitoxin system HicB family antitoxin [Chloroflexia bacterium]